MRLLIMGPPGAGKGTQAALIAKRYGIPAISTGEMFRVMQTAETPLGRRIRRIMAAGGYIDDRITTEVVVDRLSQPDCEHGYVLDGYPRTPEQSTSLDDHLASRGQSLDGVISLAADEDPAVGRLLKRSATEGRADDNEQTIRARQRLYASQTAPLLHLYRQRGLLDEVDALGTVDEVTSRVLALLGRRRTPKPPAEPHRVVPVFFLSDSTGISAETMGNALLIQFPDLRFERRLIPFINTVQEARRVVRILDEAMRDDRVTPLAFSTTAVPEIRDELHRSRCPLIDFYDLHMSRVEAILGVEGVHIAARLHGVGDIKRYNARMAAVEYAMEHDDGQSLRALEKAEVILLAPSRCGKTPTTMYLALQHGVFVANYPLVPEDLDDPNLPRPVRHLSERCVGITTSPARLAEVRQERRPDSQYASIEQCRFELRRAESLYLAHRIPVIDSSAKSVEEMSTLIMQLVPTRSPEHSQGATDVNNRAARPVLA